MKKRQPRITKRIVAMDLTVWMICSIYRDIDALEKVGRKVSCDLDNFFTTDFVFTRCMIKKYQKCMTFSRHII